MKTRVMRNRIALLYSNSNNFNKYFRCISPAPEGFSSTRSFWSSIRHDYYLE